MFNNRDLFTSVKRQKMTEYAFFSYVGQITNNTITDILLSDDRFSGSVIDANKVYLVRLGIKFKKRKMFRVKSSCIVTGRERAKLSFFGHISRFQLKEMVCDGRFLVGVSRFGW